MQSGFVAGVLAALDFGQARLKDALRELSPDQLAAVPEGFQNSVATLAMHLAGVEASFAYRIKGEAMPAAEKAEYLLDQPQKPLPRPTGETAASLIAKLEKSRSLLTQVAEGLTDADLDREWVSPSGKRLSIRYLLSVLPQHQGQHFGHIQYVKRLVG